MGQKINPISLRLGVTKQWPVRWFFPKKGSGARTSYAEFLREDEAIRATIKKKIGLAGIAGVEIERTSNSLKVLIRAARPGLIIGRGGKGIEEFTKTLEANLRVLQGKGVARPVSVTIEELKRSEVSAAYTAQQIAWDLEKRLPFRHVMRKYVDQVMQNREARGTKVLLSGRLGGAEIARREVLKKGPLPLQNLRADIDYGTATANTAYGTIGVKVWIYRGEIFAGNKKNNA